ncbi:MAG: type II toxin-antitoxin system HicB family antitoxin [Thermomicrobia bacterium]|nr:type II toxin-antitoxin system HicB family antitoxin [Thermomicrobia bacterium]
MLTTYIHTAMRHAANKMYEDGIFFATIPGFQGVWAHAGTVEECREELREVLEDWLFLSIADHDVLSVVDCIDLNAKVLA